MNNSKPYFKGVPTEPDVTKLMTKYPVTVLIPELVIPYAEISSLIGLPVNERFRGVTMAWRGKVENDYNIIIGCVNEGGSFIVLPERGKVELSRKKLRTCARAAKRSFEVSGKVDVHQLTQTELANHQFNMIRSANIVATAQLRNGRIELPVI